MPSFSNFFLDASKLLVAGKKLWYFERNVIKAEDIVLSMSCIEVYTL